MAYIPEKVLSRYPATGGILVFNGETYRWLYPNQHGSRECCEKMAIFMVASSRNDTAVCTIPTSGLTANQAAIYTTLPDPTTLRSGENPRTFGVAIASVSSHYFVSQYKYI